MGLERVRLRGGAAAVLSRAPATRRGILVLHPWWGLTAHVERLVTRLARAGWTALAPDLFDGVTTRDPDTAAASRDALEPSALAAVLDDAAAALDDAGAPVAATLGEGMGGALAIAATAAGHGRRAVAFHPAHPTRSPGRAGLPGARVLLHHGRNDRHVWPADIEALTAFLEEAGAAVEVMWHDAGHGFLDETRQDEHVRWAARRAWDRTLEWLAEDRAP